MVVQVKFRRNMRQFVFEVIALERTRYVLALDEVLDATLDFRNTPQKCWSRYLSEIIRSADRHGSISLDVIVEKKGPRDEWLQVVSDRDLTY